MFKANEKDEYRGADNTVVDTIVGTSIKIEGDLTSQDSIVIEGEVVGSLKTEKSLKIGEKAKVVADVQAQEARICGKVEGNITVQGQLELTSTAEVNGDLKASTLIIASGAIFNGRCSMTEPSFKKSEAKVEIKKEEEEE